MAQCTALLLSEQAEGLLHALSAHSRCGQLFYFVANFLILWRTFLSRHTFSTHRRSCSTDTYVFLPVQAAVADDCLCAFSASLSKIRSPVTACSTHARQPFAATFSAASRTSLRRPGPEASVRTRANIAGLPATYLRIQHFA